MNADRGEVESESLPRLGSAPSYEAGSRDDAAAPAEHALGRQLDAAGLERVERRIVKHLRGAGALVVHDLAVPATATSIDLLCIAPTGITAIDVERDRDGHGRAELVDRVLREAEIVTAILTEVGIGSEQIRGVICRPRRGLELPSRGGPITVGDERAVARVARRSVSGKRLDAQLALAVVRNHLGREGQRSHRLSRPDGF